uniref:Hemolymph juvenile hormone binding protein n=1 Tax=Stomoxys calcitrans TaxID=35570 RepID=A0A1I8NMG5_STOCA|nr:unnamed protein product [Stomoxys calcitrans]
MVNCGSLQVLLLLAFAMCFAKSEFPNDPKPCKHGDVKCLEGIINYIAKEKFGGYESLNLPAFDPIKIGKMSIKQDSDSPVNIDLTFTNNEISGLRTSKFANIKGFGKDISTTHELVVKSENLYLAGDYKISGKVLLLPISGTGKHKITLVEPTVKMTCLGVPNEKNGETHMKLDKCFIDLEPKKIIFNFENLLNDKSLGDTMNQFLTDNWKEVFGEIRTSLGKGLGAEAQKVLQRVFDKHPYAKLFAD